MNYKIRMWQVASDEPWCAIFELLSKCKIIFLHLSGACLAQRRTSIRHLLVCRQSRDPNFLKVETFLLDNSCMMTVKVWCKFKALHRMHYKRFSRKPQGVGFIFCVFLGVRFVFRLAPVKSDAKKSITLDFTRKPYTSSLLTH